MSQSQEFAAEPWNYVARMYQEAKRLFGEGSLSAQVCYRQHCVWSYGI